MEKSRERGNKMLFEKFGEFNSAEEINRAAAEKLAKGDTEAIYALAKENGIDVEEAEDYINGLARELCGPLMAANGKLDVEEAEMQPYEIMKDWVQYIRARCLERPEMALAVRKKGKSLRGCIAELLKWSFSNAKDVDKDIVKAAGISAPRVTLGIPGMGQAKKIITEYYLGKKVE